MFVPLWILLPTFLLLIWASRRAARLERELDDLKRNEDRHAGDYPVSADLVASSRPSRK